MVGRNMGKGYRRVLCISAWDVADRGVVPAEKVRGMTLEELEGEHEPPLDTEDVTYVKPEVCEGCGQNDICGEFARYQLRK